MTNLYDSDFWKHVAVGAFLILCFIWFLYRRPKQLASKDIEVSRCRNICETILTCIKEAESVNELVQYQDEADQFFIDNYDLLGYKQSMEFYNTMTQAVINRRNGLKKPA